MAKLRKNKKYDPPSFGKSVGKKTPLKPFGTVFKTNQPAFKGDNTKNTR